MERGGNTGDTGRTEGGERPMLYCLVPRDLVEKLHEPLRRHFREDPGVEVIVERRGLFDRRADVERRAGKAGKPPRGKKDRRTVRGSEGRRVGERRAEAIPVSDRPELPRKARPHAERLVFFERMEPRARHAEEVEVARLVARFQAGDNEAFGDLYRRYFNRVYSYLLVIFHDPHDSEDAAQQSFLKALEALRTYELRGKPFGAWLFTIVRNYALDELKRMGRVEVTDPDELARMRDEEGGEEDAEPLLGSLDWIRDPEVLLFVERLPLPQRQVLVLRYLFDFPHKQIAAILDRSYEDVRILLHRSQKLLRERLTAIGYTPGHTPGPEKRSNMRSPKRYAPVLSARRFSL